MLSVSDSLGAFPVPAGAGVAENVTDSGQTFVILSSITPEQASSFYLAVLPRRGFRITSNALVGGDNGGAGSTTFIEFSGHGYKGTIGALSNLPSPAPSFPGGDKNLVEILLAPK